MKFLIDAQLTRRLCGLLQRHGHDAIHTLFLIDGNRTTDGEINRISVEEKRVVITKDSDFVDTLILRGLPYKLLLVSTGNLSNVGLESLLIQNLERLVDGFDSFHFIEMDQKALRFHF